MTSSCCVQNRQARSHVFFLVKGTQYYNVVKSLNDIDVMVKIQLRTWGIKFSC